MGVLAIDPGNELSAFVLYNPAARAIEAMGKIPNADMLSVVESYALTADACAIEMIASYGMAVGAEVFETVFWIGRFAQRWEDQRARAHLPPEAARVFRKAVKLHLCGTTAAKDPNVRQALVDMFGPGKDRAIGKKATPGPLFGVAGDVWSALAVAVTFAAGRPDLCGTR